jgi:hypothetical protein
LAHLSIMAATSGGTGRLGPLDRPPPFLRERFCHPLTSG